MNSRHMIEPGQEWTIDLMRPEDAPGVSALFRDVYGEDYPVKAYLDPDLLIKENQAGRIISSVARTVRKDIVGHNALFNSAPCTRIFETGAGLVHKDYRGGHGIFTRMVEHGIQEGPKKFNVELAFGEPVCNHPFSQKLGVRTGFIVRAMEVNLMPAEAYSKEASARSRVTTLLNFKTLKPNPCTVHVPKAYEAVFPFLYDAMDDERRFVLSDKPLSAGISTRLTTQVFDFAKVARVAFTDLGQDIETVFKTEERRLLEKGIRVIQVWLPSGVPWIGAAVDRLRGMGYFLGGVLPRWFDTDGLLMEKILDEPDWDGMVIETERAQQLAAHVRQDYEQSVALCQEGNSYDT